MKNILGNFTMLALHYGALSGVACGATLSGLWQLDGNLGNSIGGGLSLEATNWTPAYTSITIAGQTATVLDLPALTGSQLLGFTNQIGTNGTGTRTNSFSIAWDVNFRSKQTFESLLQTNPANSDDVDIFIDLNRVVPMSGSEVAVVGDTWYRIVATSSNTGSGQLLRIYVNGTQISGNESYATDSRYTLAPATNYIFTDDNGETGDAYLNSFAVWNGELTPSEVAAMGSPTSTGIPEPGTVGLWGVAAAGVLMRRRRDSR